jgi:hypothetical protein
MGRRVVFAARRGSERLVEELDLPREEILGNGLLRRHVSDPGERQHGVQSAGLRQALGELQCMRDNDVVIG